jgi:3-isopropylmalate dehydrogenase
MKARIAVLPGDGIGPEVTREAVRSLEAIAKRFGHEFEFTEALVGGVAMDQGLDPLPAPTLALCERSDAILFGAIGDPKYSDPALKVRPELAILGLRQALGLYANLRPVVCFESVIDASPLKPHLLKDVDILMVRELTGGIYFGDKTRSIDRASDLCVYERHEIERIVHLGAKLALSRRGKLTSVDKANVLETSRLWREVVVAVCKANYPELHVDHMYVDAASMHLLRRPADFDVIITENMFGDILTDEASMLPGSLGLCPSASIGAHRAGLYEPIHGSAPDIAGKAIANPYAAILSAAWLLRESLQLDREADHLEQAVRQALANGVRTADLNPSGPAAKTHEAGAAVLACL